MKRWILLCALLGCAHREPLPLPTSPLVATSRLTFPQRPQLVEASAPVALPNIESFQLANGLSVLVVVRPELHTVKLRYTAAQGGEAHGPSEQGWASLARRVTERTLSDARGTINFELSSGTRLASSWFDLEVQPEALPAVLQALAGALASNGLAAEVVSAAVDEQLDAVHNAHYQQGELARQHAHQVLYGDDHPYGTSLDGSLATLKPLTVAGLEDYKSAALAPEHSVLVVVGNVERAVLQAQLTQAFAQLPASGRVLMGAPRGNSAPQQNARGLLTGGSTAYVVLSFRAPLQGSADDAAFQLLSLLTGDLLSSRLWRALRDQGALTYGVHARVDQLQDGATFDIETQVAPQSLLKALRVVDAELAKLRDELVSSEELALAKLQVRERFAVATEDEDALLAKLGQEFALHEREFCAAPAASLQRQLDAFEAVSAEQVRDVARRYLQPEQRAAAVAGDLREFELELTRWYGGRIDVFVPKRLVRHFE